MYSREAINTKFIVFGLIRSGFEPMTYRTQGEHANHYTSDVVKLQNTNQLRNKAIKTAFIWIDQCDEWRVSAVN